MTLPPSPVSNSSANQKAKAMVRYMAVRHLSPRDAAQSLGITASAVRDYRRDNPEVCPPSRPVGPPQAQPAQKVANHLPKPTRPSGGAKTRLCVFGAENGRVNRVTLKREPFDVPSDRPAWEVRP